MKGCAGAEEREGVVVVGSEIGGGWGVGGGRGLKWVLTGFEEIAGAATTQVSPCSTHLYSTLIVMARTITGWAQ